MDRTELDRVSGQVVSAAIRVHTELGPGLLEGAYQACLVHELKTRGLHVQAQITLPLQYRGTTIDIGYRVDLLVCNAVIVEVKAISRLLPIHEAQLLSYLRLGGYSVGLLINFHVPSLRDGIRRLVHHY